MRLLDAIRVLFGRAEVVLDDELALVERLIHTEERNIATMITDALNTLAAARDAVLAKLGNDEQAVTQANAARDAAQAALAIAQGQLSDAESQINAIAAQLNPPA